MVEKMKGILIYGATGYSGSRIVEQTVKNGLRPVIAGRNHESINSMAHRMGLKSEVFDLKDSKAVGELVSQYSLVLNCAGPFLSTFEPLVEACLQGETHYLDITGEVTVYETLAAANDKAVDAGVMLMPGVGFDMVPGDCLALMLKNRLPDASELEISYSFGGTLTRGSIRSALASFSPDSQVRRDGKLVHIHEPKIKRVDFEGENGVGEVDCLATTFGDISIAWKTTKIPNITSYLHYTKSFLELASITSPEMIDNLPEGPTAEELENDRALIMGEVKNSRGDYHKALLITPQVYAATFPIAADIVRKVSEGCWKPGFQTPALVFGADYILDFPNVDLRWKKLHRLWNWNEDNPQNMELNQQNVD